jgi:hypothetical protein
MLALLNFSFYGFSGERDPGADTLRFRRSHRNTGKLTHRRLSSTHVAQFVVIYFPLRMFSASITNQSAPKEMPPIRAILNSLISPSFVPVTMKAL